MKCLRKGWSCCLLPHRLSRSGAGLSGVGRPDPPTHLWSSVGVPSASASAWSIAAGTWVTPSPGRLCSHRGGRGGRCRPRHRARLNSTAVARHDRRTGQPCTDGEHLSALARRPSTGNHASGSADAHDASAPATPVGSVRAGSGGWGRAGAGSRARRLSLSRCRPSRPPTGSRGPTFSWLICWSGAASLTVRRPRCKRGGARQRGRMVGRPEFGTDSRKRPTR